MKFQKKFPPKLFSPNFFYSGMLLVYGLIGPLIFDGIVASDMLRMSAISLCLVLVNISCIFVSAVVFFKVKRMVN